MIAPSISSSCAVSRRIFATSLFSMMLSSARVHSHTTPDLTPLARDEVRVVQNPCDGFRVTDLAGTNPFFGFAQRDDFLRDLFVIFRLSFPLGQTFREKDVHALAQQPRGRVYLEQLSG